MRKIRVAAGPLFFEALTAKSYRARHPQCRGGGEQCRHLAWMGDALLYLVATEFLIEQNGFGSDDERALGELDSKRMTFTSRLQLQKVAVLIRLTKHVRRHGHQKRGSVAEAEHVEAVIGAIKKQSGEAVARAFICDNIIAPLSDPQVDNKVASLIKVEEPPKVKVEEPPKAPPTPKLQCAVLTWDVLHGKEFRDSLPKDVRLQMVSIEHGKDGQTKGTPGWQTRLPRIAEMLTERGILEAS